MRHKTVRTKRRWPKHRGRSTLKFRQDWFDAASAGEFQGFDTERELPGTVYSVPDKFWGFEAVGREDHPGICMACNASQRQASLIKGTDARTTRWHSVGRVLVDPTPSNGLVKTTAFELAPRLFRLRRVVLLHDDRRMGKLDPPDFDRLKRELDRVFKEKR